jgi:hypothetical protein
MAEQPPRRSRLAHPIGVCTERPSSCTACLTVVVILRILYHRSPEPARLAVSCPGLLPSRTLYGRTRVFRLRCSSSPRGRPAEKAGLIPRRRPPGRNRSSVAHPGESSPGPANTVYSRNDGCQAPICPRAWRMAGGGHVYWQVSTMSSSIVLSCVNSTTGDTAYNPVAVLEPVAEDCHPEDPKAVDKSIAFLKDVSSAVIAVF